jgi:hypothetical protein
METSTARLWYVVTWLALGAGRARRHGAPFGLVGRHGGGLVMAGHGE